MRSQLGASFRTFSGSISSSNLDGLSPCNPKSCRRIVLRIVIWLCANYLLRREFRIRNLHSDDCCKEDSGRSTKDNVFRSLTGHGASLVRVLVRYEISYPIGSTLIGARERSISDGAELPYGDINVNVRSCGWSNTTSCRRHKDTLSP